MMSGGPRYLLMLRYAWVDQKITVSAFGMRFGSKICCYSTTIGLCGKVVFIDLHSSPGNTANHSSCIPCIAEARIARNKGHLSST